MGHQTHKQYTIPLELVGTRLDSGLAALLELPRSVVARLITSDRVTVNAVNRPVSYKLGSSDVVEVLQSVAEETSPRLLAIDPPAVLYEDSHLLIVDKPAGVLVHPTGSLSTPSLAGYAATVSSDLDANRPGIVHRLDRDTSGVVIIAKTTEDKLYMQKLFSSRQVHKSYLALVYGSLKATEAVMEWPIGRHPTRPTLRAVSPTGRPAVTSYHLVEQLQNHSLLSLEPKTGRTHQLRVHLARLGHPIVADPWYAPGRPTLGLARLFLHAATIEFTGPGGTRIQARSPLPAELSGLLDRLRDGSNV
jgi:23S rRNA pseudouridine1911/1915/1917 synthase